MITQQHNLWTLNYVKICIAYFLKVCSFALIMPIFVLYITEHLGIKQSQTGIILSSYTIALILIRPVGGYLVDIHSRKKVLILSFACYLLIFFGYYFAAIILVFVIVRFMQGLAWGLSSVASNTLAVDIIPTARRTEGISYYGASTNIAMAICPFISVEVYHTLGFHKLLLFAIGVGLLGLILASTIQVPLRPTTLKKEPVTFRRFFLVRSWLVFINHLIVSVAIGTVAPFIVQYGKMIKIANPGIFFTCWSIGIVAARMVSGKFVDKGIMHIINVLAISIIGLSLFFTSVSDGIYYFCVAAFTLGVGVGMVLPALQTIYINMASDNQRGAAISTYLIAFDGGAALGMLVGGYISAKYTFPSLFMLASFASFLSVGIYWFCTKPFFESRRYR